MLEVRHRCRNLGLRGIHEVVENMRLYMWVHSMVTSMGIKHNLDAPMITSMFRVRKLAAEPSKVPRDVIAVTSDVSA
ncbi:Hypothetical predicted protein [Pelobates cultripes]|uniref:Uncharacterized protein n=1 Tax=Pelobates cultripes TaxID=61616 RepID=A0AAD1T7B2_PELCU|nr:Hypothetical predicted protein [Pelobates cultripes]